MGGSLRLRLALAAVASIVLALVIAGVALAESAATTAGVGKVGQFEAQRTLS